MPNAKASGTMPAATPGPGGEQRIRKLEAKGGVVVTQNDQVATGESALFDMPTNTVTMIGKVVVTQGQNVLRGDRLVVDMTTGSSRVESGKARRWPGPGAGPVHARQRDQCAWPRRQAQCRNAPAGSAPRGPQRIY